MPLSPLVCIAPSPPSLPYPTVITFPRLFLLRSFSFFALCRPRRPRRDRLSQRRKRASRPGPSVRREAGPGRQTRSPQQRHPSCTAATAGSVSFITHTARPSDAKPGPPWTDGPGPPWTDGRGSPSLPLCPIASNVQSSAANADLSLACPQAAHLGLVAHHRPPSDTPEAAWPSGAEAAWRASIGPHPSAVLERRNCYLPSRSDATVIRRLGATQLLSAV